MKYLIGALVLSVLLYIAFVAAVVVYADPPAPLPNQPRSDTFTGLESRNRVAAKIEREGFAKWTYLVGQGCQGGTHIAQGITQAMVDTYNTTNAASVYVTDGSQDLTIRISCGATLSALGMDGAIGCLCRGFPDNLDIDLSDQMATFPTLSNAAIALHEYSGHALGTWNEQYCFPNQPAGCFSWGSAVPGWHDYMNTGPESRHLFEAVEIGRWGRTHGTSAPTAYGLGDGFLWFRGVSPKAVGVYLFGVGSAPLTALPRGTDGGYGIAVDTTQQVCFTIGNHVDWKKSEFRSDRCVAALP